MVLFNEYQLLSLSLYHHIGEKSKKMGQSGN